MKTKKQIKERIEKLEAKVKEYEKTTKYEEMIGANFVFGAKTGVKLPFFM